MQRKKTLMTFVSLAGVLSAGVAQARGHDDVQWSVTVGNPGGALVHATPRPVFVQRAPRFVRVHYRQPTRWDRDGDGIPNRFDRVYNPRWDVDGDGIPNRFDRWYNPPRDRDGDGIPNRRDPRPDRPGRGLGR